MTTFNSIESITDYTINSAVLTTNGRSAEEVDIKRLIISFQIYENIELPFLTADFLFIDTANIIQDMDFQGGEKLIVEFQHSEEKSTGVSITKEFLIKSVENVVRADEATDSVQIHCIEYHAFTSSVQNINRSFVGSPTKIISSILNEFLEKDTVRLGTDLVKDMKVIVPNLNPLQSVMWLKKRSLSTSGLPFFLYSTIGTPNLILRDLGHMMEESVINLNRPFIYAPSLNTSQIDMQKYYNIIDFTIKETEDLLQIINQGLVSGTYNFYDTSTAVPFQVKFNVEDVFKDLSDENRLGGENTRYVYGPDYKVKEKKISEYSTKSITQMSSSGAYRTGINNFRSYQDDDVGGNHRKKIVSQSLKAFLTKSPIEITVSGREFITGDNNYSLGRLIRILFIDTESTSTNQRQIQFDSKKSGDYLILAAKHTFDLSNVRTKLFCGRLGSLSGDFAL